MTFVEMMFAVALGDTASQVAKISQIARDSPAPILEDLQTVAPSLAHLFLVVVVVAMSWVGWYHSSATQQYMRSLKPIFSDTFPAVFAFPFIMLMIDVFLVVCYFILSEGVEVPVYDKATNKIALVASVKAEIDWVMIILVTYLVWNTVFAFHSHYIEGKRIDLFRRSMRILTSLISVGLAYAAFRYCRRVVDHNGVVMIDVALLAIVLMFRLQGVDDTGKLKWWDLARGGVLGLTAIGLIWWNA